MDLNSFQIIVIKDTYEIFNQLSEYKSTLANVWGLKLNSYKSSFQFGVCPNDKLDYFSNHIIICSKNNPNKVYGAVRNISLKSCKDYNLDFPAINHMFGDNISVEKYLHVFAINEWIKQNGDTDIGYSNSFALDKSLPKNIKKYLFEFICFSFSTFYRENSIPNIIHGINTLYKLDKVFEKMAFKDLSIENLVLKPFRMTDPVNVDIRVMISENYSMDVSHFEFLEHYQEMWKNRIELSKDNMEKGISTKLVS